MALLGLAERAALYIKSDIVEGGVDSPIEGVTSGVNVAECVIACSIPGVSRGSFEEETACYLSLFNRRAQDERARKQNAIIGVVEERGKKGSLVIQ